GGRGAQRGRAPDGPPPGARGGDLRRPLLRGGRLGGGPGGAASPLPGEGDRGNLPRPGGTLSIDGDFLDGAGTGRGNQRTEAGRGDDGRREWMNARVRAAPRDVGNAL